VSKVALPPGLERLRSQLLARSRQPQVSQPKATTARPPLAGLNGGQLLALVTNWYCPNCGRTDQTREVQPHTRYHDCPKLAGMSAPLLPQGTKAKVFTKEREDYVGQDLVRLDDNGRPIMTVITVRDEGQDAMVFAPTAVLRAKEL